jgi:hypothetical protein
MSCIAIVMAIVLYVVDKKSGGILYGKETDEGGDSRTNSTTNSLMDKNDNDFIINNSNNEGKKDLRQKLINPASQQVDNL